MDFDIAQELAMTGLQPRPIGVTIIEENRPVREALARRLDQFSGVNLLEVRPYLPTMAADLIQANPQAILLGFPQMSVANPEITYTQVKELTANQIAVIGLTPYIAIDEKIDFLNAGGADFLLKTINSDQIVSAIRKYAIR